MAITSIDGTSAPKLKEPKRTKCPGCRQKTTAFSATCKNLKGNKQCTINFCHKCLLNRYGEKAEDVALLDDWNCPKCRGICNCSQCMKKRGHKPTGQLAHAAKATGFSSVSEMLRIRGHDSSNHEKKIAEETVASVKESLSPNMESIADSLGKENSFDGNCDLNLNSQNLRPVLNDRISEKKKQEGLKEICNSNGDVDISLRKKTLKEPKISEEIIKEEKDKVYWKISEKKRLKFSEEISKDKNPKVSEGIVMNDVMKNENDGGYFVETKKSKTQADVQLPLGANLTTIAGTEITPENVGSALQFLEFCAAFGEVLDLSKGHAEYIIRGLIRGKVRRTGQSCPIIQLHVKLLSLIQQEDMGEKSPSLSSASGTNSWLRELGKCVSESKCPLNDIPFDCCGVDGYDMLDCSKKLKLLNFLCDEALSTKALRNWIDDQNSKFVEREKQAKEKVVAAKEKEKQLKKKLQDEVAKAIIDKNGAPLSIDEHEAIISKIKSETAQAHSEMLEAMGVVPQKRQRSDAVRTDPILLEDNGHALWRLKGYASEPDILLQDLPGSWDAVALDEKWYVYNADQKPAIEKYISTRTKRLRVRKATENPTIGSVETDLQS
ncbi:hypothetical protein EZV62_015652 [Acer yangbiense]|uniref:DDT domain-containing protein n=1 Tax=Acer yangbiense TaxID=1000413 RepID=A0A5C7HLG1_9ROSI|nr:hypothetical protein EZV62_015652 [Acer yangbiense]